LGAGGTNPGDPVPFQLEARVGDRRTDPHKLRVSLSRRQHQEGTDCGVSQGAQNPPQATAVDRVGRRARRSNLVRDYLDSTQGHVQVAFLPPYAPDLNPVEYLWAWLKRHALANYYPNTLAELGATARNKLRSAQRRTSVIAACWAQAELVF